MGLVEVGPKPAAVKAKCRHVDQAQCKWRAAAASIKSVQEKAVGLKAWQCPLPDAQQPYGVPATWHGQGILELDFGPAAAFTELNWHAVFYLEGRKCAEIFSLKISVKLSVYS